MDDSISLPTFLKGKDISVSHRHFKEGQWCLYANSKSCFQWKVSIFRKICSWKQLLEIIIFIHRCFISYSCSLSGSSVHPWQQSHISQVKNKIPPPIIAACNTTWILVGRSNLFSLSFFLSDYILRYIFVCLTSCLLWFQVKELFAFFSSNWLYLSYFVFQVP